MFSALVFVIGNDNLMATVRARDAKDLHLNNEDDFLGKELRDRLAGIPSATLSRAQRDLAHTRHDR